MRITKRQLKRIINEVHPRAEEDDKYFTDLSDLEDELKNAIANALEKGLIQDDLEDAWNTAKEYIDMNYTPPGRGGY